MATILQCQAASTAGNAASAPCEAFLCALQAPQHQGKGQIPVHAMPSGTQQCLNLPQLLLDLPWTADMQPDEGPDPSNLARRLSKDAADSVPMWDLSIALDALRLLLWPVVPGDMPPGELAGFGMAHVSTTDP